MYAYNTLSKKKEKLIPINGKNISFFVCGPTVYDYIHIGNAKTYIQMDIIARCLSFLGYKVTYLQNITDIDDKIIERSKQKNIIWNELTKKYIDAYFEDIKAMKISSVSTYAKATDHIPEIILQVQKLLDKGYAYRISDGIYFEVSKFHEYGKLSGRQHVQEDDAQSRIDHNDEKRGWNDFCLWKYSKPEEPSWEAPFGNGRPGWHIEDTAITEHYFGAQYDIHGGAVDLIFPHHEAEITQMEAASGKSPLVRCWLHAGFLNVQGSRMGKSKGNFTTFREVLKKGYDANTIRLFFAQSHYRSAQDFSWDSLDASQNLLRKWQNVIDLYWQESLAQKNTVDVSVFKEKLKKYIADDFDTPSIVRTINELFEQFNSLNFSASVIKEVTSIVDSILGIDLFHNRSDIHQDQKTMLAERAKAKHAEDFNTSDAIRLQLQEKGIRVKDSSAGQIWSRE